MRHTYKTIYILLTALLCSCSLFKGSQKTQEEKLTITLPKEYSGKEDGELYADGKVATHVEYEIDNDTVTGGADSFILPESMTGNTDSLLNSWQARFLTGRLDRNVTDNGVEFTDTMYAKRLASMPTIVRMPYNSTVRACIDRYTKNKQHVSYLLGISEFYMPMIEEEIDRRELPHELKYLPIIESAMNPKAKSRMGAKGLWQFMFPTAKHCGLKANNYIDERYDPQKSTQAALGYLEEMYGIFQDWELAIAAYNCGPGNVNKAIKRSGGKTGFWEIYRWLPKETRGYLPAFIAANYIMTFYKDHGISPMEPGKHFITDTIHVNKNLHFKQIVEVCGADIEELRALNPQYIKDIIPGENETYVLRLTNEMIPKFIENESTIYGHNADIYFPQKDVAKMLNDAKKNDDGSGNLIYHKIKNGETLGGIALKYKVSVKQIMKWNGMKNSKIRAGKKLKIYR